MILRVWDHDVLLISWSLKWSLKWSKLFITIYWYYKDVQINLNVVKPPPRYAKAPPERRHYGYVMHAN